MVTFGNDADLNVWEKATTPPGMDGGDAIDTSTFHNSVYRTKWPQSLVEITDGAFRCAYAPENRSELMAIINVNQEITVTYNDGATDAFWGYLKSFVPDESTEGAQPEATVEIVITNMDNAFAEQAPVQTPATGT
jgi:hypothetical protein